MNRPNIIGFLSSVLSLSTLVFVIMDGSHFSLLVWPYEAFQGLVFSFVWGFGVSTTVGYFILNNSCCYCGGSKFRGGA